MNAAAAAVSEADLIAFADGRLDPARRDAVAAWLEANPEERKRVDAWQEQNAALHAALDPVADEPVPAALQAAARNRSRARRWPLPTAAAVAGIAIGLGAGWLVWAGGPAADGRSIADLGLSAYQVYVAEVRHPVEVTVAEEAHLTSWLSKRIDFAFKPPDLSASGLKLLGGRVVPKDGHPAALLMYEGSNGDRYTLLIARSGREPTAATQLRYAEGEGDDGAFYWLDGTVGYVLCGPDNRDVLMRLARAVYDQLS